MLITKGRYAVPIKIFWILLCIAAAYLGIKFLLPWFLPFVIAFSIARLLEPLIHTIAKKTKLRRSLVAVLLVLLAYFFAGALLYFLITRLAIEPLRLLPDYIAQIPYFLQNLQTQATELIASLPSEIAVILLDIWNGIFESITVPKEQIGKFISALTSAAVSLPNILAFIITLAVSTVLIAADYQKITQFLRLQIPMIWRIRFVRAKEHITNTLWKWIKAMLILLSITFVELCVGLFVLGVKHACLTALMISVVDLLPILGVGSVLIPWSLFEALTGGKYRAVGLIILYGTISLVRNFLEPKILGTQLGLHPLVMLVCVYVGYRILGLWGILLLPVAAMTVVKLQEWGYIRVFHMPKENRTTQDSFGGKEESS